MSETTKDRVADPARFEMTKTVEKKEDGRFLIYYSFEEKPKEQSPSSEKRHV